MMDELVFLRETLRRRFGECVEQLEKAADSYDPADKFPAEDLVAAFMVADLSRCVADYSNMVSHRIKAMSPSEDGR